MMNSPVPNARSDGSIDPGRQDLARRSERLSTAMREFEALSLAVSHDFRVPLRFVEATLRKMSDGMRDIDAESRRDVLAMRGALSQISRMIFDLEELCTAATRSWELEPVDMEAMVREIWTAIPQAQGLAFTLGKLPSARGDRGMLSIVWRHLLANAAARCADSPGPCVEVTGGGSPAFSIYSVRDNGTHLALNSAGKLNHSFEQVQVQSKHAGAGVALAIVQRIVTRHRGSVWVESGSDRGAVFQFSIGEVQEDAP